MSDTEKGNKDTAKPSDSDKEKKTEPTIKGSGEKTTATNNTKGRQYGKFDRNRGRGGNGDRDTKPRPTLDVYSFHLIHLANVSNSLNWGQLRKTLSERFGRVKFIETFEAWTYKKIGHVILEFETAKGLSDFVDAIQNENFLEPGVKWEVNKNRRQFFNNIYNDTGVDLLACKGVPQSFNYKKMMSLNKAPPVNPAGGWVTNSSDRKRQYDGSQGNDFAGRFGGGAPQPLNAFVGNNDAQLRARPLNNPFGAPNNMGQPIGYSFNPPPQPVAAPWQQQQSNQLYDTYGQMIGQNQPFIQGGFR